MMLSDRRSSLPTRSGFRSVRYRTNNKERNTLTADSTLFPKFRIKRNSMYDSTMAQTTTADLTQMSMTLDANHGLGSRNVEETGLESFKSTMSELKSRNRAEDGYWRRRERVKVPLFSEKEGSDFTVLD